MYIHDNVPIDILLTRSTATYDGGMCVVINALTSNKTITYPFKDTVPPSAMS